MKRYTVALPFSVLALASLFNLPHGLSQELTDRDRVLLSVDQSGAADCFFPALQNTGELFGSNGMLLWKSDDGSERWKSIGKGEAWPQLFEMSVPTASLNEASRGVGFSANASLGSLGIPSTLRLEPLGSFVLVRGSVLISPRANSIVLSPFPILRRTDAQGELQLAKVQIYQGSQKLIDIPWEAGQSTLNLQSVDALKSSYPSGLKPGTYSVKIVEEDKIKETNFSVSDIDERAEIEKTIFEFRAMVTPDESTTFKLLSYFEVEQLLSYVDSDNRPLYLGDALDVIERIDSWEKDEFLRLKHRELSIWLANLARDPDYSGSVWLSSESNTQHGSDDPFDSIRTRIASGRWSDALSQLEELSPKVGASKGTYLDAMRNGYLAVVYAESGPLLETQAFEAFENAVDTLQRLDTEKANLELSRIQNNFANFHLLLAQNHLHNHAFQMAAGTPQPLLRSAYHLEEAKRLFLDSLKCPKLSKANELATKVNLARTYLTIADLTSTLAVTGVDGAAKAELEKAMYVGPSALLKSIVDEPNLGSESEVDEVKKINLIIGSAFELLSQTSFRSHDWKSAERYAADSLQRYLGLGFFPGLESTYRLRALIHDAQSDRPEAIRNMRISKLLAEVNRARFPADRTGQSRAGFFSRQAVIYEKLAEWYLLEGDATTALGYVEQAKSRAAQDLLERHQTADASDSIATRDLPTILKNLPPDTSVVEYFLTSERGWGFLIQSGKPVRSFPLNGIDGSPIPSQQLLASVRQLLSSLEGQAPKMVRRVMSGNGMDNSWQDELFTLRSILLPDEIISEIRKTKSLVLVPQHILHYLPFSALVTKKDDSMLEKNSIAKPRFLIDENLRLLNSPSLTTWDATRNRQHAPFNAVNAIGLVSAPGAPALPGVEKDLSNLKEVFGSSVRGVVEDGRATEEGAAELLGEPGLLMLATHGFNDADKPLDSYLLFLGKPGDETIGMRNDSPTDGRLTAREILSHRVNARLIVMSACYSGLSDRSPQPGDDLFGLQRSFLQSGARCVLSGLWDVYDGSAPVLIRTFYEELKKTSSPSLALPTAQRAFLNRLRQSDRQEPWLHPYFWSVFNLCGAD